MTSYQPELGRWTTASIALYLKDTIDSLGIEYYVEGMHDEVESAFTKNSAVLRVTGPDYFDYPGCDLYKFEVLVLLTSFPKASETRYNLENWAGQIAKLLSAVIPVYRHGDTDPATQAGCLQRDRDSREFVRTVNFGLIDKDLTIRQVGVLAKYEIELPT